MKCKREDCEVELVGRQRTFCSDRCRKSDKRKSDTVEFHPDAGVICPDPHLEANNGVGLKSDTGKIVDSVECVEKTLLVDKPTPVSILTDGQVEREWNTSDNLSGLTKDTEVIEMELGESGPTETFTIDVTGAEFGDTPASLEDYMSGGRKYAKRENPHKLNWGDLMGYHDLQKAGFTANRVSIPGDFDYEGVYAQA